MRYNNGEATVGHDDNKYRDNCDKIDFTKDKRPEYTGREVPASERPPGVRCRIVYGKKD
jgi:hypothetical protein